MKAPTRNAMRWLIAALAILVVTSCSTPQQTERTLDLAARAIYIYSITESGK